MSEHDRQRRDLQEANNREVERRRAAEAEVRTLRAHLDRIIAADDAFRAQLPPDWEGDPVTDACTAARPHLEPKR